ncbi:MAG TPA: ATP-binding protein [Steroidobacteraceae bacterium]|nr:ATP-binding protein [Steroidobacteraceae bacterium]
MYQTDGEALGRLRAWFGGWPPLVLTAAAVAAAALLRVVLDRIWADQFLFLPFFPAVLLCAMVAGWRYGALATAASALVAVLETPRAVDAAFATGIAFFVFANAVMIMLAESERRARARAEAAAADASERERRFTVMADSVPLMIWVHDAAGRIQFVNRRWEEFFGVTQERARRDGWQILVHDDDRIAYETSFLTCVRLKAPFRARARVRRADGEWRWIESHGVPRLGARGELLAFAGTSLDVTERNELEAEREQLLESERAARTEAELATRAKDEFLATLSHELRTPLSVIVLWSRILARKYGTAGDDLKKGLALIIDNGMALSQLIGDLLDMSRIVSGRVTLDMRPVDAAELVTQAVASHRPAADARRITLTLDVGPQPKIVLGDPTRLQQVLWNLLSNALKFTRENGHIWVTARRRGTQLAISVRDDGEGIAPEFLSEIFSRFKQADSTTARRHGGLGLGLAIVKQLTELQGGEVRAESNGPGTGATFTVTMPLHESSFASVDTESTGTWRRLDPDRLLNARLEGLRVLAVEDQAEMLESLRQMLEDQGARVTTVASGLDALDALRAHPQDYDAMVSDIGMPSMDGYELIRRVRNDLGLGPERLLAVALTAYTRDEDRTRALQSGFQAHLAKPYQIGQLVAILHQLQAAQARHAGEDAPREQAGASVALQR